MHVEGITLAGVVDELQGVEGAFVQQIYQPAPELLTLELYRPAGKRKLKLLIAISRDARLHLTAQKFENPPAPSAFCMLLRKHLKGGVLEAVEQPDLERLVDLVVNRRDGRRTLRAELLGPRGNVVLLQDGEILGALKPAVGARTFRPHERYEPPPAPAEPQLDPRHCSEPNWLGALQAQGEKSLKKAVAAVTAGIGPRTAQELCIRAGLDPERFISALAPDERRALWAATRGLFEQIQQKRWAPCLYEDPETGAPVDVTPFPYAMYAHLRERRFGTLSEAMDAFHAGLGQEPVVALRRRLERALRDKLEKLENAIRHVERDLQNVQRHEELKACGDLLMAQLHKARKGQTSVELDDFFRGGTRTVRLDPTLTPVENARRYYERARKLKRALERLAQRLEELKLERRYVEELQAHLEGAETPDELKALAEELREEGLLPPEGPKRPRPQAQAQAQAPSRPPLKPRRLELDGWLILIGRSGRENDRLVREAHPEDWWLHARERPGAHVIVKGPRKGKGERPPEAVLLRAAQLAAYYSRGRGASRVPVTATRVKYVRKPKGAKPGLVLVTREEATLVVEPKGLELDSEQAQNAQGGSAHR